MTGENTPSDGSDRDVNADGSDSNDGRPLPPPPPEGNNRAVGNSGGAPKGNQNGIGNSGGSPAPQNQNAAKHHLHADPANVLATLAESDPEAYAWIESKAQYYLDQAPFEDGTARADQLRQVATREYAIWQASGIQMDEGVVKKTHERTSEGELVEVESEHPANLPLDRMERTVTRRLKELGVLGGEDSQTSQEGMESEAYEIVDVSESESSE